MLTERTTTLFVSIFYFQKCQTRDIVSARAYKVKQFFHDFNPSTPA